MRLSGAIWGLIRPAAVGRVAVLLCCTQPATSNRNSLQDLKCGKPSALREQRSAGSVAGFVFKRDGQRSVVRYLQDSPFAFEIGRILNIPGDPKLDRHGLDGR